MKKTTLIIASLCAALLSSSTFAYTVYVQNALEKGDAGMSKNLIAWDLNPNGGQDRLPNAVNATTTIYHITDGDGFVLSLIKNEDEGGYACTEYWPQNGKSNSQDVFISVGGSVKAAPLSATCNVEVAN